MFENYKFRCSSLGKLMVKPRSKGESLSETTKAFLREVFIEEMYGRRKEVLSKYIEKGNLAEEDSLALATKHYGKLLIKNKETLENDYVKGTPDIHIGDLKILDVKTSWDIWTFASVDGTDKNYYWQLQGYMWLTGKQEADLAYCLVNTPEHLIVQEKSKKMYLLGLADGTEEMMEMEAEVEKNMMFDDIPEEFRIKVYPFKFDSEGIKKLTLRIEEARSYLDSLTLLGVNEVSNVDKFLARLKDLLEEKNMTPAEFANLMGISKATVYLWLKKKTVMGLDKYYKALEVLNIKE